MRKKEESFSNSAKGKKFSEINDRSNYKTKKKADNVNSKIEKIRKMEKME